jgi:hypothetical protein
MSASGRPKQRGSFEEERRMKWKCLTICAVAAIGVATSAPAQQPTLRGGRTATAAPQARRPVFSRSVGGQVRPAAEPQPTCSPPLAAEPRSAARRRLRLWLCLWAGLLRLQSALHRSPVGRIHANVPALRISSIQLSRSWQQMRLRRVRSRVGLRLHGRALMRLCHSHCYGCSHCQSRSRRPGSRAGSRRGFDLEEAAPPPSQHIGASDAIAFL